MSDNLRFLLVIFSTILFFITLNLISKDRIPIRYSLFWIFSSLLLFLVGIFPGFIYVVTKFIGFETISNMVIGIILILLLFITLILTIIVSGQQRKIKLLIQEISILKERGDFESK